MVKCKVCGTEYPSKYYFASNGVCSDCFDKQQAKQPQSAQSSALQMDNSVLQDDLSEQFRTLAGIGKFIEVIGWLLIAISILITLFSLTQINKLMGLTMVVGWMGGIVLGLLIVAQGQIIRCVVSIERNTHRSSTSLGYLVKQMQSEATAAHEHT